VGVGCFSQVTNDRTSCVRGGLDWILGKISSPEGLSSIRAGGPGKWWGHHPWGNLKDVEMWRLGTRFSGGLGSAKFMVEFDHLKGLFQPNDSTII